MRKGVFIVFEGIDGSGKSSCIDSVVSALGKNVIRTSEPTDGEIGTLIRSLHDITPETEALLFTADRAHHTAEIKKWLDDGKTVICDRYYASTLAYQSSKLSGHSADIGWLKAMNDKITIEPDITFLFDIDPKKGMERVESRGSKSRFERLGYLEEVRANYLMIAKERGFEIIDASRPKDDVFGDVMQRISKLI